jgi:hypothetical protein
MQSFHEKKRIFRAFGLAFPEHWAILAGVRVSGASAPVPRQSTNNHHKTETGKES